MADAINPYAAPVARVEDAGAGGEAEAIRREHIQHEASVKSVGALYYIGGTLLTLGMALALLTPKGPSRVGLDLLILVFFILLGAGQLILGWGVRRFKPWARIASCVLSGIGLLAFPIGTLINGYILYILLSKKGRTIFSPEYLDVVAATPHVKYRTSILVWIFLIVLVVLIVVAIIGAFAGR